jgi:PAS domain-containing protein
VDAQRLTLALVEAQVGSLVDVLPVALLITSADGEILRANDSATDLFGAQRALAGEHVTALLPFMDGDLDTIGAVRGAIYSCNTIRPVDVRLRRLQHDGDVLRLYVIHEV